jgi:predicted nucleic-acid-binding Zn-ribbon protein
MADTLKCPKCEGEMEEGMTVEYKSPGGFDVNINLPKKETWGKGLKSGFWMNSVEEERAVVTYRCKECGYLESYAQ